MRRRWQEEKEEEVDVEEQEPWGPGEVEGGRTKKRERCVVGGCWWRGDAVRSVKLAERRGSRAVKVIRCSGVE